MCVCGEFQGRGQGGVFQRNAGTWLASGRKQPLLSCRSTNARLGLQPGQTLGSEVKLSAIVTELIGVGRSLHINMELGP